MYLVADHLYSLWFLTPSSTILWFLSPLPSDCLISEKSVLVLHIPWAHICAFTWYMLASCYKLHVIDVLGVMTVYFAGCMSTNTSTSKVFESFTIIKSLHWLLCLALHYKKHTCVVDALSAMLLVGLMAIQNIRRLFECLFISVYSRGTMNVLHYLLGIMLYTSFSLGILCESPDPADIGVYLVV